MFSQLDRSSLRLTLDSRCPLKTRAGSPALTDSMDGRWDNVPGWGFCESPEMLGLTGRGKLHAVIVDVSDIRVQAEK
jgi:hypothetical protein